MTNRMVNKVAWSRRTAKRMISLFYFIKTVLRSYKKLSALRLQLVLRWQQVTLDVQFCDLFRDEWKLSVESTRVAWLVLNHFRRFTFQHPRCLHDAVRKTAVNENIQNTNARAETKTSTCISQLRFGGDVLSATEMIIYSIYFL